MTSNNGPADADDREPAAPRKKVRRVRVIEVLDDGDLDDGDIEEVLAALDEADEPAAPAKAKRPPADEPEAEADEPAGKAKRAPADDDDPAPADEADEADEPASGKRKRAAAADDDESVAAFQAAKARKAAARPVAVASSPKLTVALVTVLVAALAVLLVWQWRAASTLGSERDERAAVAKVAGEYGNAAFSYSAADYKQQMERSQRLLGGDLLASYKQSTVPNLGNVFAKNPQLVMSSQIKKVYVGDVNGDLATAVVLVDIKLQTPEGTNDGSNTLLRLALKKESGGWKITEQKASGQGDTDVAGQLPTVPGATPKATPTKKKD